MTFSLYQYQIVLIAYLKFLLMVYGQIKNVSFLLIFETVFLYGVYIFHKILKFQYSIFLIVTVLLCVQQQQQHCVEAVFKSLWSTITCHLFGTVRFSTTKW